MNLDDINIPQDPILRGGPVGDIMSDGVPPRRKAAIRSEKVAVAGLQLDTTTVPDGFPFHGGVKRGGGKCLEHLAAGHAEEEGVVGGGEVFAVAAFEADDVAVFRDVLDEPAGGLGGAVSVLCDGFFIFLGEEVFVVVAAEAHRLGEVEEVHACSEFVGAHCLHICE